MKFSYPTASTEEIEELKRLVKHQRNVPAVEIQHQTAPSSPEPANHPPASSGDNEIKDRRNQKYRNLFKGAIANVDVTIEPFEFDNPARFLLTLMPELTPYKWQFEELMRVAGYLNTGDFKTKTEITDVMPFKLVLSAANGSGKDIVMIAACAVWFMLTQVRGRVVITSSSFDQTKFQTEVHIRELVKRFNKRFGVYIHYTQFHYLVPELGSEIKLFATDEPSRAEGYHPFPGGKMMLIMNEAKSIKQELFDALSRCTGYSHWLEISSPGNRRGHMYKAVSAAIQYPNNAVLGQFYFRKVSAFECPHLPKSHIQAMAYEKGENSPWYRSSILAEFSDYDEPVVITEYAYDMCLANPPEYRGNDIAIGLDLAAGGDETTIFVRKGNKLLHFSSSRQTDTTITASWIDGELGPWKSADYVFRADDGGVGHAIIDMLSNLGWRIRRTNNQSPAYKKDDFLNLGAELYFYVKRLIERQEIILPNVPLLKDQLTSRRYKGEEATQGKKSLESKKESRACGLGSPDRGDGFVLCFSTFRPTRLDKVVDDGPKKYSIAELLALERRGMLFAGNGVPPAKGRFTQMVKL